MKNITSKQFQILTDINLVWDFMVDNYGRNFTNGVAAPFFEYAITSSWMNPLYTYLDRIWLDGDKVVGFIFTESTPTDIFFNVRPGYEEDIVCDMMDYAQTYMPNWGNNQQFMLFSGQEFLMKEAEKRGFTKVYEDEDFIFDFQNVLDYKLPDGFHFVSPENVDIVKLTECCWKGFNHEQDKGPFVKWEEKNPGTVWNPHVAYHGNMRSMMAPSPHATPEYNLIIENKAGEYVCFSGMWWVPQNQLAYMEPLCTVPEYRHMGLAAAALSEHYRRMKKLGATHMTGGSNPFYKKLGYGPGIQWNHYKSL